MNRWTPSLTGTKDLTAFSVVCELQFHYLKKYYYALFAERNNWLLLSSSSSVTLARTELSKVTKKGFVLCPREISTRIVSRFTVVLT